MATDVNVIKGILTVALWRQKRVWNRFMPPVKFANWNCVRDALDSGPTAPQTFGTGRGRGAVRLENEGTTLPPQASSGPG